MQRESLDDGVGQLLGEQLVDLIRNARIPKEWSQIAGEGVVQTLLAQPFLQHP